MGKQHEQKTKILRGPRIDPLARRESGLGAIAGRREYTAGDWPTAILHVEQILLRGNAARTNNVAGKYTVTELVMR